MLRFAVSLCLALLHKSVAESTENLSPKCTLECAVTGLQKLYYIPGHSYSYTYSGSSLVKIDGIQDAETDLQWHMEVDLDWTNPCDVIMNIKNPVVMGTEDKEMNSLLTKHPLLFTMSEGVVQGVCSHYDEDPVSLNLKKGIISALQNVLPSFSVIHTGKTYKEFDVLGKCPTHYTVRTSKSKTIVSKFKNHFECSGKYSEGSMPMLSTIIRKSPFPIISSTSSCIQEIQHGIIESVKCEDSKEIKPVMSNTKYILARQISEFRLKEKTVARIPILNLTEFSQTNLEFDTYPQPRLKENVPKVLKILEEICLQTTKSVEENVPFLVNRLIKFLNGIPSENFIKIFEDIKKRKICPYNVHLQTIFMDVVAYVKHDTSIKIMIDEISKQDLTGMRSELYIASIFLRESITDKTINYLIPIFSSNKPLSSSLMLAAGSLIHKYCNVNKNCHNLLSVAKIFKIISDSLKTLCSKRDLTDDQRYRLLSIFKTIGNIGKINDHLENEIFACIQSKHISSVIRVSAIQSFRLQPCLKSIGDKLLSLVLGENEPMEIRLEAFITVMKCPNEENIEHIVDMIKHEQNEDVRSFIVSYIYNGVTSNFPSFRNLKQIFQDKTIPFEYNITSSRNVNLGYFSKYLDFGFDFDTNFIFDMKKIFQKYDDRFSLAFLNKIVQIFEVSSRMKNKVPSNFFEQSGYKMDPETLELEQIKLYTKTILLNLLNRIGSNSMKEVVPETLNSNLKDNSKHQWDAFIRLFDTEILFLSLHNGASELREANAKSIKDEIWKFLFKFNKYFSLKDLNSTRSIVTGIEIFLPTAQGIPVLLKWDSSTLFGLHVRVNSTKPIDKFKNKNSNVIVTPEFSSESRSFLGYSFGAKVGVKNTMNINLSSMLANVFYEQDNKFKVSLPTSEAEINIWDLKSDTYLFRKLLGNIDTKIIPKSFIDPRIVVERSCLPPSTATGGIKLCWKFNVSDIRSSNIFPFGNPSTATVYLEMDNLKTEKLQLNSVWQMKHDFSSLNLDLETVGESKIQKEAEITFNTTNLDHHKSFQVLTSIMNGSVGFGLKVVVEDKTTKAGTKNMVSVYATSSSNFLSKNKVIYVTYDGKNEKSAKPNVNFKLETMNNLSEILNVNIKVIADVHCKARNKISEQQQRFKNSLQTFLNFGTNSTYRFLRVPLENSFGIPLKKTLKNIPASDLFTFPLEITVHNMEIQIGSGDLQTETSLETMTYEEKSSEYNILTKLEGGKSLGGVKVLGFIAFRGILDGNLAVTSKFTGKFGNSHEYQTEAFVKYDAMQGTVINFSAENASQNSRLAIFKYSTFSSTKITLREEAEVFVVGFISHYKLEGLISEKKNGAYQLAYDIKREETPILHIKGPITVFVTPEKAEEKANLTIEGLQDGIYKLLAGYSLSTKRSYRVFVDLSLAEKEIAYLKFHLNNPNADETHVYYHMRFPSLVDVKLEVENTLKLLQTNLVLQILPNSSLERTIRSQSHLYYNTKKMQVKVSCEDDHRNMKSFFVDTKYGLSAQNRSYHLNGDMKLSAGTFSYDLELSLGDPTKKDTFKHLLIKLTKPSKQHFLTELLYHHNVVNNNVCDVTGLVRVETLSNNNYQLGSNFCYAFEPKTSKVEVAGQINMTYSSVDEIIIKVNTLSTLVETSQSIQTSAPPILNDLISGSVSPLLNRKNNSDIPNILERDFRFKVEFILPSKTLRNATFYFEKNSTRNEIIFESFKNLEKFISVHSHVTNNSDVTLNLVTPSRSVQLSTTLLSKEFSLTLYPNKEWTASENHSVGGRYVRGSKFIYEDEAIRKSISQYRNLNSVNNKVNFLAHVAIPQTSMTGAIELNINNDYFEKVSVSIESIELSKRNFKTEMIFRSPSFALDPRILLESSFTPSVKSLTVSFQHEKSVPPSVTISGTHTSITEDQSNIYYFVKTPDTELEFTSSLNEKSYRLPFTSLGFNFNGTFRSSKESYDFNSAYCKPAYFELGVNKRGENFSYVSKVGSQQEFSLIGINQRRFNYTPEVCSSSKEFENEVTMASVSLYSPMILQLQAFYDIPHLIDFVQQIKNSYKITWSLTTELAENIWKEIFCKLLHKDSIALKSNLKIIYQDIRRRLKHIYDKLKTETWVTNLSKFEEKATVIFSSVRDSFKEILKYSNRLFINSLNKLLKEVFKKMDQVYNLVRSSLKTMINHVQNFLNFLQGSLFDWKASDTILKYIRASNLWKLMENYWFLIYSHYSTELEILENFTNNSRKIILQEVRQIWDFLITSNSVIRNYFSSMVNWAYGDEPTSAILKKAFFLTLSNDEGKIDMKVPLRSPAHTVRSALVNIGVPRDIAHNSLRIPLANINMWNEIMIRRRNRHIII